MSVRRQGEQKKLLSKSYEIKASFLGRKPVPLRLQDWRQKRNVGLAQFDDNGIIVFTHGG